MSLDGTDKWKDARDEFAARTLPFLKEHGKAIGVEASCGDKLCIQIITLYTMLARSFDPLTWIRLDEALGEYSGRKPK